MLRVVAVAVAIDQHVEERVGLDDEARLLRELAADAVARVLVLLQEAAREVPLAAIGLDRMPLEWDPLDA